MRPDNFENTGIDATAPQLSEATDTGGGQTPPANIELTAPDSGASSFSVGDDSAAPAPSAESVPVLPKRQALYESMKRDPAFNMLVATSYAGDKQDWMDIQAGVTQPEDLPETHPIRAAILSAENLQGQKVLMARREAERLGVPVPVALESPEKAHNELMAREIEKNVVFAEWAAKSRENAAVALFDFGGLDQIFKSLGDFVAHPEEWGRAGLHWLTQSKDSPLALPGKAFDDHIGRPLQALGHGATEVGRAFYGGLQMLADMPALGGPDSWLATTLRDLRSQSSVMEMPKPLQGDTVSGFERKLDRFWMNAFSAIPGMATAMMATVGTGGLAGAGWGALAGTAVMGHQIAGSDYLDYTEKQGISRERARSAAFFNAVMQAPLENLGNMMFLKAFASKGLKKILLNWAKAGLGEAVEEYAQKWPEFLANIYAESEKHGKTAAEQDAWSWGQLTDTSNLLNAHKEGLYEAAVGLFLGLMGGSVHVSVEAARLQEAREFADAHKKFHETIVGDRTALEAPSIISEILKEHNPAMKDSVNVSAEELYQLGQNDASLFERLGMAEEQVKQDAADGQIYEIPVADLHAYLNDKKQFDAVMDIVREDADAYNAKEGTDKGFSKEILNQTAEEVKGRYQKGVELFQSRVQEEGNIQNELVRLHQEVTQAVLTVPSLRAEAKQNGGVGEYVNKIMTLLEQRARKTALDSKGKQLASDSLRRMHITGENLVRNVGDAYVSKNFISPQSGQTVAQQIESEFQENRVRREFEDANRSDFFENMEVRPPLSDFQTAGEMFGGPEWRDTNTGNRVAETVQEKPKERKREKAKKGRASVSKPMTWESVEGEKVPFRGGEITLLSDGTVLRLPDGTVTAAFRYEPRDRAKGQTEKEARALQSYYFMERAVAQMGSEAVDEMDGTVETLERLLESGPESTGVIFQPEKERAKADLKTDGKTAEGHVAGCDGWLHTRESDDPVRYELWELDDLNISHDATNGFAKNLDYPEGVQDRPYHEDEAEKNKVRVHASGLRPDMIITDNPDMVNGPTIVALDGDVLGGNSRAMTMQLVYEKYPENADKYLKMLMDKAHIFGFTSDDVAKFRHPVLVRVVQQQLTNEEKAHKATLYNETPTQELGKVAEGVARGKLLTDRSLSILVNRLAEGEYTSLRDFLRHADAKPFVDSLIKDGVIKDTEIGKYLENDGSLTVRGQDLVEDALCGYVVPNTDVVQKLRNRSRRDYNRLLRVLPYMAVAKKKGGDWDISNQLTEALRLLGKQGGLDENLGTNSLIDTGKQTSLSVEAIARAIRSSGKEAEMVAHFATFAKLAMQKVNPLMGVNGNLNAASAFTEAFLKSVAVVDGQPVLHFDRNNAKGSAYAFVVENGGKGHRASVALQALEEKFDDKNLNDEQREALRETQGVLTQIKGRVDIYGPVETMPRGNRELLQAQLSSESTVREQYEGTEQWMKAPNGKPTNLTEEQWLRVRTPEFKAQFGDWEQDSVNSFVDNALSDKDFQATRTITVSKESREKISTALGIDLGNFVLTADDLRHEIKKHGDNQKEAKKNQEKITPEILKSIPWLLNNFDEVLWSGRGKKNSSFLIKKRIDGHVVLCEWFAGDKAKTIHAKTIRIEKGTPRIDAQGSPNHTSEYTGRAQFDNIVKKLVSSSSSYALDENGEPKITGESNELFQQTGTIFGSTQIMADNSYVITLFQGANLSSLLHETAHVWFEEMERIAQMEDCPEDLKADFAKLRAWVGAEENVPLDVEQKEQLARGMEAYFREGKAPSEELTGIFARFKHWLMKIYQIALQLNVQLTDEVREVFDRMFATDEEIREVYRQNEIATRTEEIADALNLTGADRKAYMGAAQGVADAAAHNIDKERNANARMRRKQYEAEAHAIVDNDKIYPLVDSLKDAPLDLEDVKANFGQDMVNQLRAKNSGWVKKGSSVVAEELAAEYGYDSAEEMLNDLVARGKSKRKAISDYVRERIAEYDAQHSVEDSIEDNEKIIQHLEMEGQYVAKHVGQENVSRHDIRVAAVHRLMGERMFYALRPEKYRMAYRRAIQAERRAILKGDFNAALTYNYQARFNFEMAAMSRNLVKNLRSTQKTVRKFVANRKYDPRARFGAMALASQHGMVPWQQRLGDGKDAGSFEAWQKEAEREGYFIGVMFDEAWEGESEPRFENRVEYITVGDYSLLAGQLSNIIKVERNKHKELRQAQIADVNELSQELADTIHANRETVKVKTFESDPYLKRRLKDMHANHSKIEVLCEALDGRPLGPLWQAIYAPINEAEDNQTRRLRKMKQDMDSLFSVYTEKEKSRLMTAKQMEPAIGESITMQQRLMVALNMGNEGNLKRLRNGHNLTDEQIAAIVAPLTERDWRFVESVWDYLDTFREEAFQLEEDVNGLKPEKVEAQPFTVTTSDGKTLNIKGGYFPIRYSTEKEAPRAISEVKLNEVLFDGLGYASIQTRQGALRDRTENGKPVPLMLSFNVIADHAFNMIHDICYRKAILDVAKIVQNETFREAFATTDAMHLYKLFMPWLQDCAREKISCQTWFDPLARWGRSATTMMMMGLKFTTMFTQPVGLTQSAHVLGGWKYLYRGLRGMFTANPYKIAEYYQDACARSAFMEARMMNYDRDVRDMLKQINAGVGLQKVLNKAKSVAFTPMGWFQMYCVDLPTWHAAYEKGIKDYAGDEKKAVAYADHVVRMSQGSGATKDLAAIQRGGESQRLLTMFYSYFNTLYNVAALHADWAKKHHTPADMWLTFCAAMNLWFIPAIVSEFVAGRGPGDDDDKWWWALKQELNYPLQTIVGFRELGNALLGEYDYQFTPAEMAPKSIVNWMKALKKRYYEGTGSTEAVVKKSAEMGGYLFGLPLKQVIINTDNFYKWMIDEADFRFRDLFFPPRKNESRRGQ